MPMVRMADTADLETLVDLRCARYGESRADAAGWLQNVAGLEHILVLQHPGKPPAAMLAAVPVKYTHRNGIWFCGAAAARGVEMETLLPRLLSSCLRAFGAKEYDFAVLAPENAREAQALEALGFKNLLPMRVLQKPIHRNLLAQAGGAVASTKVESELASACKKLKITNSNTTFTFKSDKTYTQTIAGKSTSGTYTFDRDKMTVVMTGTLGFSTTAHVKFQKDKMTLVYDADRVWELGKSLANVAGKFMNSNMLTIFNSVSDSYEGMQLGFELQK